MHGLLRRSLRCLASYRDGKRLADAYQLLITKKPVEYDYVAIDVNSFFGGAQRLTKNVTQEQRKNRDISRHVLNAIQQLLRRIVCKHALLLAFDGAGTAPNVHHFRNSKVTRRQEIMRLRLPGMSMARAVEEKIVKSMPLARSLIPREVVVSGTTVEGCVERKVVAWALDLACRDGTQHHTARSLCVIGSSTLWQAMLGLTPFFQGTHVIHGSTDLRHLTLSDLLSWLELGDAVQRGDTHAVTTGRTDALLLTLLAMGCELTELPVLPGANFTVLMDAYHRRRRAGVGEERSAPLSSGESTAAAALLAPSGSTAASGRSNTNTDNSSSEATLGAKPRFQLFHDLPNGTVELDLLALYVLFLPENEVAEAVAELTKNAASPFSPSTSLSPHIASSPVSLASTLLTSESTPDEVRGSWRSQFYESYLSHVLSTHYLLCYGETTAGLLRVPAYFTFLSEKNERMMFGSGGGSASSSGGDAGKSKQIGANASKNADATLSVAECVRFLQASIRHGHRYRVITPTPPSHQRALPPTTHKARDTNAVSNAVSSIQTKKTASLDAATTTKSSSLAAATFPPSNAYYPFWSAHQPWTAAEYTILCQTSVFLLEQVVKEYLPDIKHKINPDVLRDLVSLKWSVDDARGVVQRLLAHASAESPHPTLCFGPSYCWTQHEKSRMWHMRYVDLGIQAKEMDIRHVRGLLSGMDMAQPQSEEGAMIFDAEVKTWVVQPTFPILPLPTTPPSASIEVQPKEGEAAMREGSVAQTLKVLTWNVMFDRYSGQPTPLGMPGIDWCSPKRYPVLAKIIAEENADVVGLQEVELPFAEYLAAQSWCRDRYILSCNPHSPILDPWGVLLLVRRGRDAWPVQQLTHFNVPAWSGHVSLMPVVTLSLGSRHPQQQQQGSAQLSTASSGRSTRLVNVCSMHLLAPYLKAHETARTGQDQALRTCLTRQLHGDTLVMGDFNDWPSNEFVMPAETRYVECWPLVHPGDYGKTMDESNTFCKLKIEEIFFGRSDKVFLRTGSCGGSSNVPPLLKPVEAHLVGTRSVNSENGNQEAPEYLFPSDHYGVSMTFEVLQRPILG